MAIDDPPPPAPARVWLLWNGRFHPGVLLGVYGDEGRAETARAEAVSAEFAIRVRDIGGPLIAESYGFDRAHVEGYVRLQEREVL